MRVLFFLLFIGIIGVTPADDFSIAEEELKKATEIEFENFEGREDVSYPVSEVINIGKILARGVQASGKASVGNEKYAATRYIGEEEKGFDADVIFLLKNARVNHTKNIARILQGYLGTHFGYSRKDGRFLGMMVVYYNGLHRGDAEFFKGRLKSDIVDQLETGKIGLALSYKEWPGNSSIIIPIKGSIFSDKPIMGTGELTEGVMSDLEKEGKEGFDKREKMIEIEKKQVEKEKKDLASKEKSLEKEKKKLAKEVSGLEKKDRTKQDEVSLATKKERLGEIEKTEDKVEARKDEIADRAGVVEEAEKKLDADKEFEKQKSDSEKYDDAVRRRGEALARQEEALRKTEAARRQALSERDVYMGKVIFLKKLDYLIDGHYDNQLMIIDPETDKIEAKTSADSICSVNFEILPNGNFVLLSHAGAHSQSHFLTEFEKTDLRIISRGTNNIFWRAPILVKENEIFSIVKTYQSFYLAKFSVDGFGLMAKSTTGISPDSQMTFFKQKIYLTGTGTGQNREILILSRDDLSLMGHIAPALPPPSVTPTP